MNQFFNTHDYNNNGYWYEQNTNENYNTLDIKIVYCHFCYYQTTIKNTKTNHKRLRCDLCRILSSISTNKQLVSEINLLN
jgi:hypothetical protein